MVTWLLVTASTVQAVFQTVRSGRPRSFSLAAVMVVVLQVLVRLTCRAIAPGKSFCS
ncbi:hypothetical protein D3C76_1707330 [compost metagenome]